MIEAREPLGEEQISRLLEDIYVPGMRLANPHLRQWFGETDAWWMDNLRRNVERLEDETMRAQALVLGMQTGDYALSFTDETRDLRRPLTTVFWRLAGRALAGPKGHPHNRSYNQPADEFIKARAGRPVIPDSSARAHARWRATKRARSGAKPGCAAPTG